MRNLFALIALCVCGLSWGQQQPVNTGSGPNTGSGDPIRTMANKLNANDAQLYGMFGNGTSLQTTGTASAADLAGTVGGLLQPRTAAEITAGVTPVTLGWPVGHAFRYMTSAQIADVQGGTHSLDDSGAVQNAMNVGGQILMPCYTMRLASGVTVPAGTYVTGQGCGSGTVLTPTQGATWQCDLSVATCVTLGGASYSGGGGVGIQYMTVTRASGTPPAGSVGVLVNGVYNPTIAWVSSYNSAIGFEFGPSGISAQVNNLQTGGITDAHLVLNGWPELRIVNSRFGSNGTLDVNCNTYIRVTGGNSNPAGGPNTLYVINTQFNQGNSTMPTNFLQFSSRTGISDYVEYMFTQIHIDVVGGPYITSDSTWTSIGHLKVFNSVFNANEPLFSLNAATQLEKWTFANNFINGGATIAPTPQIDFLTLTGNVFNGAVSITGPTSGSTLASSANSYTGGLTLAGTWATYSSVGDIGTLTNTATATNYQLIDNGSEAVSGNLFVGSTSSVAQGGGFNVTNQVNGTSQSAGRSVALFANSSSTPFMFCGHSRGATVGAHTIVQNGDNLCTLEFTGDDGTQLQPSSAIAAGVGGTPGAGSMPGFLALETVPSGSTTLAQRLTVDALGQVKVVAPSSGGIPFRLPPTTSATVLAITCNSGAEGSMYPVTDANSAVFNAAVASGGANHMIAYCNGSTWVVH